MIDCPAVSWDSTLNCGLIKHTGRLLDVIYAEDWGCWIGVVQLDSNPDELPREIPLDRLTVDPTECTPEEYRAAHME